jgi:hypothetical protein
VIELLLRDLVSMKSAGSAQQIPAYCFEHLIVKKVCWEEIVVAYRSEPKGIA